MGLLKPALATQAKQYRATENALVHGGAQAHQ